MNPGKLTMAIATGALFALTGPSAFADDKSLGDRGESRQDHAKLTKTRVQVAAELYQARRQELIGHGDDAGYPHAPIATSSRTRDTVRAEAAAAPMYPEEGVEYSGQ